MSASDSLSALAHEVRLILAEASGLDPTQIVIGPPHEAAKQQENGNQSLDYLCVFFYRIAYSGFPADAASIDPLYLKALCMVTALGGRSGERTPGDSELRLIGAVAECFHRYPLLKLDAAQIQIVPTQLSLDDINHLWATQNNTPYRLSLSYEFSLLPVPMKARVESSPRVENVFLTVKPLETDNSAADTREDGS